MGELRCGFLIAAQSEADYQRFLVLQGFLGQKPDARHDIVFLKRGSARRQKEKISEILFGRFQTDHNQIRIGGGSDKSLFLAGCSGGDARQISSMSVRVGGGYDCQRVLLRSASSICSLVYSLP